ncbi:MAG: ISAs1 family transposase [Phycisphaeraceae bacterium]|nr:ISAs1 family transposase [Phycisphaeraceae bacterium]
MDDVTRGDLLRPFEQLTDPRRHNIVHPLPNILLIAIMAVTCGASDWAAVHRWAMAKRSWLATLLDLSRGIPSRDTFSRLFATLDPDAFERCFIAWTAELAQLSGGGVVAIDGKTIRRSFDRAMKQPGMHIISAWCERNRVVLGQLATEAKSNEITAIPKLLQLLSLKGATVTIDAMGCQKTIASQIIKSEADYLLAVKDNHPDLHEDVKLFFADAIEQGDAKLVRLDQPQVDGDHGRIETRRIWASADVAWLKRQGHHWEGLRGLVCVEGTRETLGPDGKTAVERRFFITSHDPGQIGAEALLAMARGHWGVENRLHWCLDVSFNEDQRRLRKGHGAENFSRLCRIALNLLKAEKSERLGIANKRLACGWDHDYLLKVLMNLG